MAELPRQSDALELVRAFEAIGPGQIRELYRRGDRYFVVSTVELTAAIAPAFGLEYADQGEETMAFHADADGNVTDWAEVAVARGAGSRQRVLEELSNG
jgi:peptide subunit release factor 1 (eRF1)